jgi:glutathione peroxidase
MFAKIEVNGPGAAPLYAFLRAEAKNADGTTDIAWNFTKFLVDREGKVLERFSPRVTPEELEPRVLAVLGG